MNTTQNVHLMYMWIWIRETWMRIKLYSRNKVGYRETRSAIIVSVWKLIRSKAMSWLSVGSWIDLVGFLQGKFNKSRKTKVTTFNIDKLKILKNSF